MEAMLYDLNTIKELLVFADLMLIGILATLIWKM